jgi:hypothetical protein
MDTPVDVTVLGQTSALPGPVVPLDGDLAHIGQARVLPKSVRGADRLMQRLIREVRARQSDDSPAPLYLASRSAAEAGAAEDLHLGSSVAGVRCAGAAVTAVEDGERPMVVGVSLLDPTVASVSGPIPLAEAGAAAWLAPASDPAPGPRRRVFVACTNPFADAESQRVFCSDLLHYAEVSTSDVVEVISASTDQRILALETTAMSSWLPEVELLQLVWRIGDAGPALGLLAVLAGLEDEGGALILAGDGKSSCVAVVA